jgi:hypothetical protein
MQAKPSDALLVAKTSPDRKIIDIISGYAPPIVAERCLAGQGAGEFQATSAVVKAQRQRQKKNQKKISICLPH